MVSFYHAQYQKKANDPILRKLSDRQMDGQMSRWTDKWTDETNGLTDESNFGVRCPINMKHPKVVIFVFS